MMVLASLSKRVDTFLPQNWLLYCVLVKFQLCISAGSEACSVGKCSADHKSGEHAAPDSSSQKREMGLRIEVLRSLAPHLGLPPSGVDRANSSKIKFPVIHEVAILVMYLLPVFPAFPM